MNPIAENSLGNRSKVAEWLAQGKVYFQHSQVSTQTSSQAASPPFLRKRKTGSDTEITEHSSDLMEDGPDTPPVLVSLRIPHSLRRILHHSLLMP